MFTAYFDHDGESDDFQSKEVRNDAEAVEWAKGLIEKNKDKTVTSFIVYTDQVRPFRVIQEFDVKK
jgi:hypothetical protein